MTRTPEGTRDLQAVGDPVHVRCKGEPVRDWSSAEESYFEGLQVQDLRVFYAKEWPGGINDVILYNGDVYETIGMPQHYDAGRSKRTHYWRITGKWVGKRNTNFWTSPIPEVTDGTWSTS